MVGLSSKGKVTKKPKAKRQCSKKINVIDYLSEDIWFEIFTHVNLKQMFQLKLLSKQWYVLISGTNFMTRKLNICTFFYKYCSVDQPLVPCQSIPIIFSMNTDSSDYFLSDQEFIHNGFSLNFLRRTCILGSSNGLLLFRYTHFKGQSPYQYFICNPLTRKWSWLSNIVEDSDEHESHVLVCESSSSIWNTNPTGFMVVRIPDRVTPTKKFYVKIFSSGTGKWKTFRVSCSDEITIENGKKIVTDRSGCLYWIIETNKIVMYDLKNNVGGRGECMQIDLPKEEEEDDHGALSSARSCLAESEGFIFYIRIEIRKMIASVWLLEEEENDSYEQWSWKVVHKIKLNEMLAGYDWNNTRITNIKPLDLSSMDRNIVFMQSDECILQYNMLTRRSQLLSLSSHLDGPISSYEFGVLPILVTANPTTIPKIRNVAFERWIYET